MKNMIISRIQESPTKDGGLLKKSPTGGFRGLLFLMLVLWTGCKEEGRIDHINDSAPVPAQIDKDNIKVRNTPGGAVLKYQLPIDENLLSVKVVYEIKPGVQRHAEASYFADSLVLEGFGDTKTYDVMLYSVGKNEKMSEPVIVQINPTTAPVHLATKSMRETFGGVAIDIENPEKAALAVVLMADTANIGYLSELFTFYTSMPKGTFSYRGLNPIPYDFAVFFRDRWYNYSDTIGATVTPWFEEFIPKSTWKEYTMQGDAGVVNNYWVSRLWDEVYNGSSGYNYHSLDLPLPQTLTFDLGVTVKLSRFKFWPRNVSNSDDRWIRGHPKIFELYGSLAPNPSGVLDNSWIPLGRFECVKPSGAGPQITQEDIDFALAGIDFDFEASDFATNPYASVRYIRIKTISTFHNTNISPVSIQELSFWGTIEK